MWFFNDSFLKYLRERTLLKKIQDGIFVITVVTWVALAYVSATNFKEIYSLIGIWRNQENIQSMVTMNHNIEIELTQILYNQVADRVILFRFHNGINDVGGVPFLYATATNEVVRPGVDYIAGLRKEVLVSMITDWTQEFEKKSCVIINVTKKSMYFEYFNETKVHSAVQCPVYNISDNLVGFISVQFNKPLPSERSEIASPVRDTSGKVGAILSGASLEKVNENK